MSTAASAQLTFDRMRDFVKQETSVKPFRHLDLSLTAGTTGIGFDLSSPITEHLDLRAGFSYMPYFEYNMNFDIQVGNYKYDDSKSASENAVLEKQFYRNKFKNLTGYLSGFTGLEISSSNAVDMVGTPNMFNAKIILDAHPFKNKNWRISAGVYIGKANIGNAVNSTEAMNVTMAAAMYNTLYTKLMNREKLTVDYNGNNVVVFREDALSVLKSKFEGNGMMTIPLGTLSRDIVATEDIYYDHKEFAMSESDWEQYCFDNYWDLDDAEFDAMIATGGPTTHEPAVFDENGNLTNGDKSIKYHKGDPIYKEGETFRIAPDGRQMIEANARVNPVKPYLGFGYGGPISKDKRTLISFDAGLLFWGGVPSVTASTSMTAAKQSIGVNANGEKVYVKADMCRDFSSIRGKADDYITIAKKFIAYPVLELRITQKLF